MKQRQTKAKVRVFRLEDDAERLLYEEILNDPKCFIYKEAHTYDRMGNSKITVWIKEEEG